MPGTNHLQVFSGSANVALAEKIAQYLEVPLGKATVTSFPDGETFVKIDENIRGRDDHDQQLHDVMVGRRAGRLDDEDVAADLPADQPSHHGAADHDRRGPAGQRGPDHRGDALLRLRPSGPEGPAPRPHHRQAGGQPAGGRRNQPGADHGPPRPADPGLLRHPGRPPLRRAHPLSPPQVQEAGQPGRRLPRRGRDEDGLGLLADAGGGPGHRGQAAHQRHRHRGPVHRRRGGGQGRPAGRRHHRDRRHPGGRGPDPQGGGGQADLRRRLPRRPERDRRRAATEIGHRGADHHQQRPPRARSTASSSPRSTSPPSWARRSAGCTTGSRSPPSSS